MEIDKNIDFGGARNKRTSPSNSTRKTTYIDLFSCLYDRKWSKTLPVHVRKRSYVSVHNRMYASVFCALILHIGVEIRFFGNFSFARSIFRQSKNAPRRPPPQKFHQKREKRSVAKMKVQVVAINSVQKSSKSELSSGTFGHVKVWQKNVKKPGFYVLIGRKTRFLCTNRSENPVSMY